MRQYDKLDLGTRDLSYPCSRHNVHNVQNVQNMQNMQNVQNAHTGTQYRVSEHREPGDRAGIPTGKKVPPPGTRRPLWNFFAKIDLAKNSLNKNPLKIKSRTVRYLTETRRLRDNHAKSQKTKRNGHTRGEPPSHLICFCIRLDLKPADDGLAP